MTDFVLGGGSELTFGLLMYPHGAAVSACNQGACNYSIPIGAYLYACIVAWIAALVISYRPIFRSADKVASPWRGDELGDYPGSDSSSRMPPICSSQSSSPIPKGSNVRGKTIAQGLR